MKYESICNHENTYIELNPPGHVHYGRKVCCNCGSRSIGKNKGIVWAAKPQNINKRRIGINNFQWKEIFRDKNNGLLFCELCGITEEQFNNFHAHHKKEISEGGKDEFENILILCSHCHTLIKNLRARNNRLLEDKDNTDDEIEEHENIYKQYGVG